MRYTSIHIYIYIYVYVEREREYTVHRMGHGASRLADGI